MKIDEKKIIVEELHEKFSRAKVVIVTDYKGLNVADITDLRKKLRDVDVEYRVAKNSFFVRASARTDVELAQDYFKGPSAVALSYDDPVVPAKILTEFSDDHKNFEIRIGVMNGKAIDLNAIKVLSALPSREVLLSKLLSVINGVPTAFVRALNDMPKRMLNVLCAIKEQKESM